MRHVLFSLLGRRPNGISISIYQFICVLSMICIRHHFVEELLQKGTDILGYMDGFQDETNSAMVAKFEKFYGFPLTVEAVPQPVAHFDHLSLRNLLEFMGNIDDARDNLGDGASKCL
eukprot:GHVU01035073.1.p2 GENE.GHVU01035073.1~~GHVU01035073.1.p2  ORF type:complete len:117 (+),score=2.54 GHVU01035073.1:1587-1937(+)